ncbi:MAG: TonB-dependent receptor, partial [Myxococcales bacterium]|nr:TonB-dependent receptor [Myxococcales bacterium]
ARFRPARLVLVERSESPLFELERELARLAPDVGLAPCLVDVTDRAALAAVIEAEAPPIHAVVHAAGVLDDGILLQHDRARLARVLGPKIDGARHLDALLGDRPLAFFALYASTAGVLGSPGQGAYAAANAWLDAFAARRRAEGRPMVSLDWGPWAAVGMAASRESARRSARAALGLALIPPEAGLDALARALVGAATQTVVLGPGQGPLAGDDPFSRALGGAAHAPTPPPTDDARPLTARVEAVIAAVLGLPAGERIDPQQPLSGLGLDSLMAIEARNRLAAVIGRALPATLLFDQPTLAALIAALRADAPVEAAPRVVRASNEPIAIVGIGLRLPGGARTPEDWWQKLVRGECAIGEVPADRFDINAWYDPDPDAPGRTRARHGGFIDAIDQFDAPAFGISATEARSMDPQQRLLLEVSVEALERAGLPPASLVGSATGVFLGICLSDYALLELNAPDPRHITPYSGPGGVLWGSNALLGVINIILKDDTDLDGLYVLAGGGSGPGAQEAVKAHVAWGGRFFEDKVRLYTAADFYSDRGAELEVDVRKILGVLPEPALDGKTIYEPKTGLTDFNSRDWWASHTLVLELFDTVTLDWFLQFETDYRQIATGGALLSGDRIINRELAIAKEANVETKGQDAVQVVGLNWRDRFINDRLGLSARLYGVRFQVQEDPFWAFPPRYIPGVAPLEEGVVISLRIDELYRYGLNLDADVDLGEQKLILGFEGFGERMRGAYRGDKLRQRIWLPAFGERPSPDAPIPDEAIFGPDNCPPNGRRVVRVPGGEVAATFSDGCRFEEQFVKDTDRLVGAFYLSDEWRPVRTLAIQPGFRLQISDAYDPVPLFGGALVWNLVDRVFLKLNYTMGFRPPAYDSTRIEELSVSTVSYESGDDIKVERSRAGEVELNAVLFEDAGPLRRIYLRADYGYTILSDVIRNVSGQFANSGERELHSVEMLARAEFKGDHELWLGGHFVRAEDSVFGPVRNFPNFAFTGGARSRVVGPLELSALVTVIGPQEDLTRPATAVNFPPGSQFVQAEPSDIAVEAIDTSVTVRFGVRLLDLWEDRLELSAFVYNALDEHRRDPDFFFDDRVLSRPQSRPGWSAAGQASVRF